MKCHNTYKILNSGYIFVSIGLIIQFGILQEDICRVLIQTFCIQRNRNCTWHRKEQPTYI